MRFLWSVFDTILPAPLRKLLAPVVSTPEQFRQFVTYGSISLTALILDFVTYALALRVTILPLALACGFSVSIASHFSLNKFITFRSHSRSVVVQFRSYLIVTGTLYVIALCVIESAIRFGHANALAAKLLSIPITLPFGYLSNKYLIFGPGFTAMVQRLRKSG